VMGFRDLSRLLKQLGARVEPLDAVYAEIRLRNGEVLRIDVSSATIIRMQGVAVVTLQASSITKAEPTPQQQSEFSEEDIKLLMEQTGASRDEAVAALRETGGDLVAAAMRLMQRRGS